ncbi:MAG: hypothetical protein P8177_05515 [Gemmatimonadota bacterium]|jgi:hypothetical protein
MAETGRTEPPTERRRAAVAASMLVVLLGVGYFLPPAGGRAVAGFLVNAVILVAAFWFPAVRTGSVGAVLEAWRPLVVWLGAWTLVWDLATAGLLGTRGVLQEWWLVYPAGIGTLYLLLLLHGALTTRIPTAPRDA